MVGGSAQQQAQLVENFCGVTSATRDVALFFLESHNWILDAAIAAFYEHDEYDYWPLPDPSSGSQRRRTRSRGEEEENENDEEYSPPQDSAPSQPRPANGSSAAVAAPNRRPPAPVLSRAGRKRPVPKQCGTRRNVRTFAGPNRSSGPGFDDEEEEEENSVEPLESFTGGEESGMLLRDPSRRNIDVDSIFEQASLMEAMQRPAEHRPSSSRSFTGTVRLLSGETIQSTAPQQSEEVVHNIHFWSNGFTLNDGPLRSFDDPENVAFLESIKKSECPKELAPADRRTAVDVNLIQREENCPEPVKQASLLQGVGRTLSSESSNPSVMGTPVVSDNGPSVGLSVDSSKPSTSLQLRLADGTRMVARFNTHHTVGDVRAFIDASRPGASRSYHLRTVGFPHEQLDNLMQTIEEAGLANSVIIQHF